MPFGIFFLGFVCNSGIGNVGATQWYLPLQDHTVPEDVRRHGILPFIHQPFLEPEGVLPRLVHTSVYSYDAYRTYTFQMEPHYNAVRMAPGTRVKIAGMNDLLPYNTRHFEILIQISRPECEWPDFERWEKEPGRIGIERTPYPILTLDQRGTELTKKFSLHQHSSPWRGQGEAENENDNIIMLIPNHAQCEYRIHAYEVEEKWAIFNQNAMMKALKRGAPYPGLWQAPRPNEVPYTPIDPPNLLSQWQSPQSALRFLEYRELETPVHAKQLETKTRQTLQPGTIVQLTQRDDRQILMVMSMGLRNPDCPWPYLAQYRKGKLLQLEQHGEQKLSSRNTAILSFSHSKKKANDEAIILVIPNAPNCRYEVRSFKLRTSQSMDPEFFNFNNYKS